MPITRFSGVAALLCLFGTLSVVAVPAPVWAQGTELKDYVGKADPSFMWSIAEKKETGGGTVYTLQMTSQTWQGIAWTHRLQIYQPAGVTPGDVMPLLNTGGGPNIANMALGMEMAKRVKMPVAVLYDIPNQPLFDGKKEDALIAETFMRYLQTGDSSWPLLFPMVKSVVRSMDVLQAFSQQEWKRPLPQFIVTGASKRGWTTWLTAATGDKRVKAIAPMVIDVLNMPAQMKHQKESFGAFSNQIDDYTERGLNKDFDAPDRKRLNAMVDPYSYRAVYTMPKLLLNGANDPYWTADALSLYWNDLPGDKWIVYVPNAGHDLQEVSPDGTKSGRRALEALAAFVRSQTGGTPLPKVANKTETGKDGVARVRLTTDRKPTAIRLWVATSDTRDFRPKRWESRDVPISGDGKETVAEVKAPASGYLAYFAEMEFDSPDGPIRLCAPTRILGVSNIK
jgi:PhoPQ-activated pathogenicity-related protein